MSKVQETRYPDGQGFGGVGRRETRVRELAEGEVAPVGAVVVDEAEQVHDWEEVK